MKTTEHSLGFLLFSYVWSPVMEHDKRVFELVSQTSIRNDLLHVYFTHLYMYIKTCDPDQY